MKRRHDTISSQEVIETSQLPKIRDSLIEDVLTHILFLWYQLTTPVGDNYLYPLYEWIFSIWGGNELEDLRRKLLLIKLAPRITKLPYVRGLGPQHHRFATEYLLPLHPNVESMWISHTLDLSLLPQCRSLSSITLFWPSARNKNDYKYLARCPSLSHVKLICSRFREYNDKLPKIEDLFQHLGAIKCLDLTMPIFLGNNVLSSLTSLERLIGPTQEIALRTSDLAGLTRLQSIEGMVAFTNYSKGDILSINERLEDLAISVNIGFVASRVVFFDLRSMKHLKRLSLFLDDRNPMFNPPYADNFVVFNGLISLEELSLSHNNQFINDSCLEAVPRLKSLTLINDTRISGSCLQKMLSLTSLKLKEATSFSYANLHHVEKHLEQLDITTSRTLSDFAHLIIFENMTRLKTLSLNIHNTPIFSQMNCDISFCSQLESLSLWSHTLLVDAHFESLTNLKSLYLFNITTIKPRALYKMSSLRRLHARDCPIFQTFTKDHLVPNRANWPLLFDVKIWRHYDEL